MNMKWLYWLVVSAAVLGPGSGLVRGEYGEYIISDLGSVGSAGGIYGINDAGLIVGAITNSSSKVRPAVWENVSGVWTQTELPIIAGTYSAFTGEAMDVNASGKVVGWSVETAKWNPHACTWQKVGGTWQVTDLGGESTLKSKGYGINDTGVVVGYKEISASANRCTVWENGVATNIGGSVVSGVQARINSSGTWVTARLNEPYHVGLWEKVEGVWQTPVDLGTLSGSNYAEPWRMNDAGKIVGSASSKAFLYENGTMRSLGAMGGTYGRALGINDAGVIVGEAEVSANVRQAFIYQGGVMTNLNSLLPAGSGWVLTTAWEINNYGWIVGIGDFNGVKRAFVMVPKSAILATVQFANYTGTTKVLVQVDVTQNGSTTSHEVIIPPGGGPFNLPNLTMGTYDISFKACSWLRAVRTGINVDYYNPVNLGTITLTSGDYDGDNEISSTDLSITLKNINN